MPPSVRCESTQEQPVARESCRTCAFARLGDGGLVCRRFPRIEDVANEPEMDWCGEYRVARDLAGRVEEFVLVDGSLVRRPYQPGEEQRREIEFNNFVRRLAASKAPRCA